MGKDCGTWIPHLQFGWQSPNSRPPDMGKQDGVSAVINRGINMVSSNETMPALTSSALPHSHLGHFNEPLGWFRHGFAPVPGFTAEGKPLADQVKGFMDKIAPYGESGSPQKQFLVIDQACGQTTIYSSRFGSPDECLASLHSKMHGANYLSGNEPSFGRDLNLNHVIGPILADKVDENQGTGVESEMHEDTEEINALLYSDSDGYATEDDDDDDEVTSTGHSPSTMTTHDNHGTFKGIAEEVASSAGKNKKRKLLDGYYDDIQFMDTASSLNLNKTFAMGDDAESRCSGGNNEGFGEMGSMSGNKKMRKEKIRDVLSILQSIIPGGKDKDPVMLLDDAIHCLKSLKLKAKALGLDAF